MRSLRSLAVVAAGLAFLPGLGLGQSSRRDSLRIERLTALGRLFGVVKYFHPAFVERDVPWDAAVMTAIDRVRSARSTADYRSAITGLLESLHDPTTRIVTPRRPSVASAITSSRRWETHDGDSTLVIAIPDFRDWSAAGALLTSAATDIRRAPAIVFDLRGTEGTVPDDFGVAAFVFTDGTNELLPVASVAAPSQVRRMHSGFPPQMGGTSGGYWSGTFEQRGEAIHVARPNKARRVVFLVNPGSDIPPVAFALQRNGQGSIVVEGSNADLTAGATTYRVALGEGMTALVRVARVLGGAMADTVVAPDSSADAPFRAALALSRRPVSAPLPPPVPTSVIAPPESSYAEVTFPSTAMRIFAAYRWWNAIHFFYPYKSLIGESWDEALPRSIRLMEVARDSLEYGISVAEMVASIHDSHGFIANNEAVDDHFGRAPVAFQLQYVEGQPVVIDVADDPATRASGVAVGDIILRVDGEDAGARRSRIARVVAASTPQSFDAKVATALLRGRDSSNARLLVQSAGGRTHDVVVPRRVSFGKLVAVPRRGPAMRMLPGNVGYADLSLLTVAMTDSMFEMFRNTKAIIFDDRGYPQGTAWSIAPRLTERSNVAAARFQRPLATSPDTAEATTFSFVQYLPSSDQWKYAGRTAVLVDERTISQAEHTVLFLEAANQTLVVGSPTMGANGDVTNVALPGGMYAFFTGHDVRHADGRQLQRVGIQPDVLVRPTIAGLRAGRDEVLERALEVLRP